MKKVTAVNLHETVQVFISFCMIMQEVKHACIQWSMKVSVKVDDDIQIKAYYAGHVLGAAMFQVKIGAESIVYTVCVIMLGLFFCKKASLARLMPNEFHDVMERTLRVILI